MIFLLIDRDLCVRDDEADEPRAHNCQTKYLRMKTLIATVGGERRLFIQEGVISLILGHVAI